MQTAPVGRSENQQAWYLCTTNPRFERISTELVRGLSAPKTPNTKGGRMEEKIKRTRSVQVRLTQEEYDFLQQKFLLSGYKSKSEFMRIAFFETLIVKFNADELQEMLRLMKNISANINQIAVRVNSTDKVYREDLTQIEDGVERIWQQLKYFQSQLQCIKP